MATPAAVVLSSSTIYLYMQITSTLPTGVAFDPTSFAVDVCCVPTGNEPVTFHTAGWLTSVPVPTVQFLLGPENGGLALSPGNYDVYTRITTLVEVPIIPCGVLQVRLFSP